jgi:hypothetical protein
MRFLCIVELCMSLSTTQDDITLLTFAMEMQQWIPFALLLSYEVVFTAVKNLKTFRFSCKVTGIFVIFETNLENVNRFL